MAKKKQINPDLGNTLEAHWVRVDLSENDIKLAIEFGESFFRRNKAAGKSDGRTTLEDEIEWIKSEIAVAKWAGIKYEDPYGKNKFVPDVGPFDVRCVKDTNLSLSIRKNDPSCRTIISVVVCNTYCILRGWEYIDHMRYWLESKIKQENLLAKLNELEDKVLYDKHDECLYPWCLLKPMYLLSRELKNYSICDNCAGLGIANENEACKFCPLGKMLESNPQALNQLMKYCSKLNF